MSYNEKLRQIIREYEAEVSTEPTPLEEIAQWAIEQGKWKPRPIDVVKLCRDDLSEAAREETFIDAAGREVRNRHCVRVREDGKQFTLWGNINSSPESFLIKSFSQRRTAVGRDCYKLKQDVDHFNDERAPETPYNLVLDFAEDVAEIEACKSKDDDRDAA